MKLIEFFAQWSDQNISDAIYDLFHQKRASVAIPKRIAKTTKTVKMTCFVVFFFRPQSAQGILVRFQKHLTSVLGR